MISREGTSSSADTFDGTRTSIDQPYLRSPPLSPSAGNRFIVEPQVLNAAFERLDSGKGRAHGPSLPHSGGGLPPPPRPNSRKGKPSGSSLPSPADSLENSVPSLPNSPTSSPYSNGPNTPGATSDFSPNPDAKQTPRLSNFLRGDSLMFGPRRGSIAEQDGEYDRKEEDEEEQLAPLRKWTSRSTGEAISPLDSGPSSPEFSVSSADGSRPSRHNRVLSGLQKITRLAKPKASFDAFTSASGRRASDASDVDPRRNSQEKGSSSSDVSGRYRILDKRGKGESIKQPASVPSSPVAPTAIKNVSAPEAEAQDGQGGRSGMGEGGRRPSASGSTHQSVRGAGGGEAGSVSSGRGRGEGPSLQPPPRARVSHGRQASEMSTTSSLASVGLSLSPASASDSSHDPPSSHTDARISISSTIYPSSSNNHSFDIARYPLPGRSSMHSPDRESFIDLASPTFSPLNADFHNYTIPQPTQGARTEQSIHRTSHDSSNDFSHGESPARSTKPRLARLLPPSSSDKPPIPTTPKPDFSRRSRSGQSLTGKPSKSSSPKNGSPMSTFASDLDRSLSGLTTTNALTPRERAQRVRTTHKLTQLFGQTPGVSPISPDTYDAHLPNGCMPIPGTLTLNLTSSKRKQQHHHHRPAVSMSEEIVTPVREAGEPVWPPPGEGTRYVSLAAQRRHSAPLSPDEFSFMLGPGAGRRSNESGASRAFSSASGSGAGLDGSAVIEIGTAEGAPGSDAGSVAGRWGEEEGPGSPTSFMDLSDEEGGGEDGLAEVLAETPRGPRTRRGGAGWAAGELSDSLSLSSEQLAEDERRRKREKLAKLHRFLGSRVPPHLVLGTLDEGTPLPPPAAPSPSTPLADDADDRRLKMRRRRSSSAAEFSRKWSDDIDRLKEELNEREKAINVRRAVKMEKMFGVAPPQTLYHTRAPTSSSPSLSVSASAKAPPSPRASPRSPSAPAFRVTPSDSGYGYKTKSKKKGARPGTAESSTPLIGSGEGASQDTGLLDPVRSSVYMHYRHSLNSLNDIIDRDDRESLAELHDYLSGRQHDLGFAGVSPPLADELSVATPTVKAERRRSLPSRTSIASFSSEISFAVAVPAAEPSFQQRRRRAAKLTHFFGVDYRELMNEILESIEKGLEEERGRGTLRPDEVRDLQQKLVSLKTKRNSLRE